MGALCSIRTNADVLTLQLQTGTILPYAEEGMPVVAKPLMGPVPKNSRITPVMIEVRFESKMAENALL